MENAATRQPGNQATRQPVDFLKPSAYSSLLLLFTALFLFGPSGQDDSHITYAAAQTLADHGAITNINHEWVEQGSSLLHVILLAIIHQIDAWPMPVNGILFSLAMALSCLPLTYCLARDAGIHKPEQAVWLLALSTAFSYWAMGGLESTLVSLLMLYWTLAIWHYLTTNTTASRIHLLAATGSYLLSRPESYFVLMAASIALAFFLQKQPERTRHYKRLLAFSLLSTALFAVLCLARHTIYGQIFPQPVYAKASTFSIDKIGSGLLYFLFSGQPSIILYTLLLARPVIDRLKQREISMPIAISCSLAMAHLAFVIVSGGDWMIGGRFFVPIIPLLVCSAVYYLQDSKHYRYYFAGLVLLCLVELVFISKTLATGIPLHQAENYRKSLQQQPDWRSYDWTETRNYVHIRDIALINHLKPVIAALLARNETQTNSRPLSILTIQMGMIPYHLTRDFPEKLYFIDLRGLTTRHIPACHAFADAPRIWSGVFIQYADYFAAQRQGLCNLPEPDIIYDWLIMDDDANQARLNTMKQYGYLIVYRQNGTIISTSGHKQLKNAMFIAIREQLYQQLPEELRDQQFTFMVNPQ